MSILPSRRRAVLALASVVFVAAMWVTLSPFIPGYLNPIAAPNASTAPRPGVDSSEQAVTRIAPLPSDTIRSLERAAERYPSVRRIGASLSYSLLSPSAWLWLTFFLLVQSVVPARPIQRLLTSNKLLDFAYPVFSSTLRGTVLVIGYGPMRAFFENHLPFLTLRVLDGLPIVLQGFLAFLVMDFAFWISHWARHKIPWLWYFHSIHHSDTELSPLTVWRSHPLEEPLIFFLTLIPAGIFGGDQSAWLVVTVFYGAAWPFFVHSNIRTNLGWLGYVVVSPQFHRVHHSIHPEQFDCNFGEHIVLWDWLFGTVEKDRGSYPQTGIPAGQFLEERARNPIAAFGMWLKHLVYPFLMIWRSMNRALIGRA